MDNTKDTNRYCFATEYSGKNDLENFKIAINQFNKKHSIIRANSYQNDSSIFLIIDIIPDSDFIQLKDNIETLFLFDKKNPLNRIFSLNENRKELFDFPKNSKRFVMNLELINNDKLVNDYIQIHKPENIWEQVILNLNTMNIIDMEIYLNNYQAYLIMDTDRDFSFEKESARWASLPREKEWQEYVAKFQKVNPETKALEKWKVMQQVN